MLYHMFILFLDEDKEPAQSPKKTAKSMERNTEKITHFEASVNENKPIKNPPAPIGEFNEFSKDLLLLLVFRKLEDLGAISFDFSILK